MKVVLNFAVIWGVTPCSLVNANQRFGEILCSNIEGRRNISTLKVEAARRFESLSKL
jgi:hypothetical protein